jgi:O-antigen ligase
MFLTLILLILGGIFLLLAITILIYPKIKYNWLEKTIYLLILSLPFERIPSFDTPFGTLRISQILTITACYFIFLLYLKKDEKIINLKLNSKLVYIVLFFLFSIPSWFFVVSDKKFIVTMVATILCFLAYFLISHFSKVTFEIYHKLLLVILATCFFGIYQIVFDYLDFPIILTGLRQTYTKEVFGIARIHSTALEPLYFAGMLFLPIFSTILFIISKHKIWGKWQFSNVFVFSIYILVFLLTLSKSAWLVLILTGIPFSIYIFRRMQLVEFLKTIRWVGGFLVLITTLGLIYSEKIFTIAKGLFLHIIGTFTFNQATSVERLSFLKVAFKTLYQNSFLGIGSGQYEFYATKILPPTISIDKISEEVSELPNIGLIVNNVYIEIWLEFGLLSLIIFLIFLYKNLKPAYISLITIKNSLSEQNIMRVAIFFSLITYLLQWFFFSPIFIMPIFILLGMLENINKQKINEI